MWKITLVLLAAAVAAAPGQDAARETAGLSALVGVWKVDLRPTPDAEPYFQTFKVRAVERGRLQGRFYGTEVENALTNVDWGRVCFAFVTRDNSGEYHTAGELVDGKLRGTTLAVGRNFLSVWTAEKQSN